MWVCIEYNDIFFFFKQKMAYDMRISDWSSDCALPISRRTYDRANACSNHLIAFVSRHNFRLQQHHMLNPPADDYNSASLLKWRLRTMAPALRRARRRGI